ncbi:hypothetical protein Nmel_016850, partial [Mimus melanotis]
WSSARSSSCTRGTHRASLSGGSVGVWSSESSVRISSHTQDTRKASPRYGCAGG